MSVTEKYLKYAELSAAAYGDNIEFNPIRAYQAAGLGLRQAQRIDAAWKAVATRSTASGLDVVLFQSRSNGEMVLAIRGTEPSSSADVSTDLELAAGMLPHNMAQYADLEGFYADLIAQGTIAATDRLTITGHSLGGALTQIFAAYHADVVDSAYTYNSPGLPASYGPLLASMGASGAGGVSSRIVNVRTGNAPDVITASGRMLGAIRRVSIDGLPTASQDRQQGRRLRACRSTRGDQGRHFRVRALRDGRCGR